MEQSHDDITGLAQQYTKLWMLVQDWEEWSTAGSHIFLHCVNLASVICVVKDDTGFMLQDLCGESFK